MTSTEVAVLDPARVAKLAARVGADPSARRGPRVPQLKINMDDEDVDGVTLPRGHMFLTEQEETVYAKTVKIRPLMQHFQYLHYDQAANKMVGRTVEVMSFHEELYDSNGGIRLGKPPSKVLKDASEEVKKKYEDITAFRIVRCLVSYEGETKTGEKRTVENVPALIRLKGANFSPFETEMEKQIPPGRMMWDYDVEVSLERQKNGSVTYYIMHFKPDLANPIPLDIKTVETAEHFEEMIQASNKRVLESYKAALAKKNGDTSNYDAIGGDDNLDGDFDD